MSSFNPESKIFSGESFPQVFHPNISVGHLLLHQFRLAPERVVQINADDGVEVNGEEMAVLVKKAATFLKKRGLKFGDAVGFCASNSTYLAPAFYACLLLGLPITAVYTMLNVNKIVSTFQRTKPKLIFCDHERVDKIREAFKKICFGIEIVVLTDKVESLVNFKDIIETCEVLDPTPQEFNISTDKVCAAILASSGSTGEPKLARVSHAQLSQSTYDIHDLQNGAITLSFSSLFYVSGLCSLTYSVLNQQTRLFTKKRFSAETCVELIKKHKVTTLSLLPPALSEVNEYLQATDSSKSWLNSVQIINSGGCPLTLTTLKSTDFFLPNGRVQAIYGMTEACGVVSRFDLREPTSISVGKLCINTQAKILFDNGTLGGIGDIGEVLLKRPFNIIDYLGDEQKTRDLIDDESWMHTGDVGYFDENLNLFIVGRKKMMIRCRNREVNPLEIEEVIGNVPGVQQVCVVELAGMSCWHVPAAVIQKSPKSDLTKAEVHEAVKHLEDYKQLKGGVFFVENLPLTASGKLNRIAATQLVNDEFMTKTRSNDK